MRNNILLGMGLNAFEDPESLEDLEPEIIMPSYVEPVDPTVANDLVIARDVAVETADIAIAENEIIQHLTEVQTMENTVEAMDGLSASLEHFIENGCTPAVAQMLTTQLTSLLADNGVSLSAVTNGGLESFEDDEAVKAYLGQGLEALNSEKASIGTKIAGAIVGMNQSINGFLERVIARTGRLRARANTIIKQANTASGSRHVKVKSKFLAVKGDKVTTNLASDMTNFTKAVTGISNDYMSKVGSFANGPVASAMSKLKNTATLVEAKKIIDGITPPPYPGANIAIKDTPELTLKRTDVMLGGYAVFELRYKTTGGDTVGAVTNAVKAIGKARISIKRPKEEKSDKVVFEAEMTPANAIALANEVIKCCDAALAVRRNVKWTAGFLTTMANHTKGLQAVVESNNNAEAGVGTVVYTLTKLPSALVKSVGDLVMELPSAVGSVCDAVLDVAAQAARGGEAAAE